MQLIYRARDITEAHIVSGMLQAHGLESYVGGHYLQGAIGDMAVHDFAVVHVADEHVAQARALIADYESDALSEPEVDERKAQPLRLAPRAGLAKLILGLVALVTAILFFQLFGR